MRYSHLLGSDTWTSSFAEPQRRITCKEKENFLCKIVTYRFVGPCVVWKLTCSRFLQVRSSSLVETAWVKGYPRKTSFAFVCSIWLDFRMDYFAKNLRWLTHAFGRLVNDDATNKREHLRNFLWVWNPRLYCFTFTTHCDWLLKKNKKKTHATCSTTQMQN